MYAQYVQESTYGQSYSSLLDSKSRHQTIYLILKMILHGKSASSGATSMVTSGATWAGVGTTGAWRRMRPCVDDI